MVDKIKNHQTTLYVFWIDIQSSNISVGQDDMKFLEIKPMKNCSEIISNWVSPSVWVS